MKRRVVMAVVVLFAGALVIPANAFAHARLTKSSPAANAQLIALPKIIALWFSEAPEISVTSVVLRDSSGNVVDLGPIERGDSKLMIQASIKSVLAAGRYVLAWRTAAADGHPSQGTFQFVIVASVSTEIPTASVAIPRSSADTGRHRVVNSAVNHTPLEDNPTALTPAFVVVRAVSFIALLIVIGAVVFRVAVVERIEVIDASSRDVMSAAAASLGLYSGLVLIVAGIAKLYLQSRMMNGDASGDIEHLRALMLDTQWGYSWLIQLAAAGCAAGAFALARRRVTHAWTFAGLAAIALAASPGISGHAIASSSWTVLAVVDDSLHVLGAAGWLGSLLCVVVVGMPVALNQTADRRWQALAAIVNAFSPTALGFAAMVALTGILSAWLRLGALSPLWTSTYGRVLLVKLALVLGIAGTGAYNWLRVRPSLGTESATRRFGRSATTELTIGLLVIVVTAILVAVPTPIDVG
ncbi:MAG: copper resistance CopC/CopD family protein [Gemmatimonadaceae bacterium]